jgi:hypothetical protein
MQSLTLQGFLANAAIRGALPREVLDERNWEHNHMHIFAKCCSGAEVQGWSTLGELEGLREEVEGNVDADDVWTLSATLPAQGDAWLDVNGHWMAEPENGAANFAGLVLTMNAIALSRAPLAVLVNIDVDDGYFARCSMLLKLRYPPPNMEFVQHGPSVWVHVGHGTLSFRGGADGREGRKFLQAGKKTRGLGDDEDLLVQGRPGDAGGTAVVFVFQL